MKIIRHRVNDIAQLIEIPTHYGVEIDIRSSNGELVLGHDPHTADQAFTSWLDHYDHGILILNVKEDGLEPEILDLLETRGLTEYFFLDQPIPTIVRQTIIGNRKMAVRLSELEPLEGIARFADKVDWVWLDSFFPNQDIESQIRAARSLGFQVCLVSPELHDLSRRQEAELTSSLVLRSEVLPDAVCTKFPDMWTLGG